MVEASLGMGTGGRQARQDADPRKLRHRQLWCASRRRRLHRRGHHAICGEGGAGFVPIGHVRRHSAISQSPNPTISQSYNLTISQSPNLTISQSHNLTISQFPNLFPLEQAAALGIVHFAAGENRSRRNSRRFRGARIPRKVSRRDAPAAQQHLRQCLP